MKRILVCFAYYFRGQRILRWVCGFGAILVALGLLASDRDAATLLALGSVFLAGFPILVGGLAYRQLVGNRRTALVPALRQFATGGLFLLALCGAALAGIVAAASGSAQATGSVSQLAFAAISLYLIVSQWMIAHRRATLAIVFLLFLILHLSLFGDPVFLQRLFVPWAWVAIASLSWLWLATTVSGKAQPLRWLGAAQVHVNAAKESAPSKIWPARYSGNGIVMMATAAGTLMRGSGDSWVNRFRGALLIVLLFPVTMAAFLTLVSLLPRNHETQAPTDMLFLALSLVGVLCFPTAFFSEWPVRLRLLWLRAAGDRRALWRRLERTMLKEVLLIAAIVTCVACGYLLWSDVARELVYFYLSGAVLAALAGSYLGFCARICGWHPIGGGLAFLALILVLLTAGAVLQNSGIPFAIFGLLPALATLALGLRALACSRFRRMDWCKIRPIRLPRF